MESKNQLGPNDLRQSHEVDVDPNLAGKLPAEGGTPPPPRDPLGKHPYESLTIVQSLAARSVFSTKQVEDAFQYLTDHIPHTKIRLTIHQGVAVVDASINVAQIAGTTINTQVENIIRILEKRL